MTNWKEEKYCYGPEDWEDACTDDELSCEDGDSDHGYGVRG